VRVYEVFNQRKLFNSGTPEQCSETGSKVWIKIPHPGSGLKLIGTGTGFDRDPECFSTRLEHCTGNRRLSSCRNGSAKPIPRDHTFFRLTLFHSALNPLIYSFLSYGYRARLTKIWKRMSKNKGAKINQKNAAKSTVRSWIINPDRGKS
jgi:hypothetical protein